MRHKIILAIMRTLLNFFEKLQRLWRDIDLKTFEFCYKRPLAFYFFLLFFTYLVGFLFQYIIHYYELYIEVQILREENYKLRVELENMKKREKLFSDSREFHETLDYMKSICKTKRLLAGSQLSKSCSILDDSITKVDDEINKIFLEKKDNNLKKNQFQSFGSQNRWIDTKILTKKGDLASSNAIDNVFQTAKDNANNNELIKQTELIHEEREKMLKKIDDFKKKK